VVRVLSGISKFLDPCAWTIARRQMNKHILSTWASALLILCAYSASAQPRPRFYNPQKGRQRVRPATPASDERRPAIRASTIENGRSCNLVTFEGLGDLEPIPAIDGISSPGWLVSAVVNSATKQISITGTSLKTISRDYQVKKNKERRRP
jgi:hypothetical protein